LRLPEFIIGGAPRSGTTWLYSLLERHPDGYVAKPVTPEPKFFLVDSLYERGLEFYSKTWFAAAPSGRVTGEKSTNYLESATAAERIARDLPSVKLVFILRDPVERAWSNYLWSTMNGLETEDFETAIRLEAERERTLPDRLRFARPFSYFSRGLYADLLRPYVDRFPRHHLLVLRFEDIIEDPETLTDTLHRFLGLKPRRGDAEGIGVINPSEKPGDVMPTSLRRALTARYEEPNQRLAALLGPSFSIWSVERTPA
jgi:sulfotransferase family protein